MIPVNQNHFHEMADYPYNIYVNYPGLVHGATSAGDTWKSGEVRWLSLC
jgi:hypothetical protein